MPEDKTVHELVKLVSGMDEKINHVSRTVDQNTKDIKELRDHVAMGKGGLKVIVWVGGLIVAIATAVKLYIDGPH